MSAPSWIGLAIAPTALLLLGAWLSACATTPPAERIGETVVCAWDADADVIVCPVEVTP